MKSAHLLNKSMRLEWTVYCLYVGSECTLKLNFYFDIIACLKVYMSVKKLLFNSYYCILSASTIFLNTWHKCTINTVMHIIYQKNYSNFYLHF